MAVYTGCVYHREDNKRSQNTKYHEALQVKVSTDNPRLQTLIHNI